MTVIDEYEGGLIISRFLEFIALQLHIEHCPQKNKIVDVPCTFSKINVKIICRYDFLNFGTNPGRCGEGFGEKWKHAKNNLLLSYVNFMTMPLFFSQYFKGGKLVSSDRYSYYL